MACHHQALSWRAPVQRSARCHPRPWTAVLRRSDPAWHQWHTLPSQMPIATAQSSSAAPWSAQPESCSSAPSLFVRPRATGPSRTALWAQPVSFFSLILPWWGVRCFHWQLYITFRWELSIETSQCENRPLTADVERLLESFGNFWIEFDDQVAIFSNRVVTDFDALAHPVLEWFLHYGVCDIRYPLLRKTSDISLIWKVMCYFRTFLAFFEDVVDRQTLVLRNEDGLNVFRFDIYIHWEVAIQQNLRFFLPIAMSFKK